MLYTYLVIGFLLAVFVNLASNRKELIATPKERFLTTVWIIITWFPVCIDLYLNELMRKK
mgnify:CR=1 FL=1